MDRDVLLEAIGMVDDVFLEENGVQAVRPVRRFAVLLAAVVALLAMTVTALAVSEEFREVIFSIFRIETPEVPPEPNAAGEPQSSIREMGAVDIDGVVEAFYFAGKGYVRPVAGGFYTSDRTQGGEPPKTFAFWEITGDGIVEAEGHRVDFPFTHGGKTFPIVFDYAILDGKINDILWVQNLDQGPYENGWNIEAVGGRTDALILKIPVRTERDITNDYFLLDLTTLKAEPVLMASEWENVVVDYCWFRDDLQYAIVYGWVPALQKSEIWLWNMDNGTLRTMKELVGGDVDLAPYFLDSETIIYREILEEGRIRVGRYHIPTGVIQILVEETDNSTYRSIQHSGHYSAYGRLEHEDGVFELIDLRTNERLMMRGLTAAGMQTSESPMGKRILIGNYQSDGQSRQYTSLGLLDPDTGVLKVLKRRPEDASETFWGWLDENTVALTSYGENSSYCVYIYRFE